MRSSKSNFEHNIKEENKLRLKQIHKEKSQRVIKKDGNHSLENSSKSNKKEELLLEKQLRSVDQDIPSASSYRKTLSKEMGREAVNREFEKIKQNILDTEEIILKCKYASALGKFEPDESMLWED